MEQFLPEMQLANSRLQQDIQNNPVGGKTKYDIENTEGTKGPLIEMVSSFNQFTKHMYLQYTLHAGFGIV